MSLALFHSRSAEFVPARPPRLSGEALLSKPDRFGTVVLERVLPGGGISVLRYGVPYELALLRTWMTRKVLSEGDAWN